MRPFHWITLGLILTCALVSCAGGGGGDTLPATATLDKTFQLRLGKSATLAPDNLQVTFVKVQEDSRCPSDVQCAWAGQAVVQIQVSSANSQPQTAALTLGASLQPGSSAAFGPYSVEVSDLAPYPISTVQIQPGDYAATLIVSKP
jgi:hypothetical protein